MSPGRCQKFGGYTCIEITEIIFDLALLDGLGNCISDDLGQAENTHGGGFTFVI